MNDIEKLSYVMTIGNGKYERSNLAFDFFAMLAIRISNACDPVHLEARKNKLIRIMAKYTHEELIAFEEYISLLIDILQRNLSAWDLEDTLGRMYEKYGKLSSSQELTPKGIANLMSKIVICPETQVANKGYVTVTDPTCGSGGTFLATAQRMMELGHNPVTQMVVLANDVNPRAVHMAYIQASFYGIPAVITQADILTLDEVARWYTPAYILGNWIWRAPLTHTSERNASDEMLKRVSRCRNPMIVPLL